MHVAVTGAAGMIGRKLVARLVEDGRLGDAELERLTLVDVVAPDPPPRGTAFAGDLADPAEPRSAWWTARPDVIVHLAAVVSGEAEADFDKGYRVNLDGTRALLEAIRARPPTATARGWCSPRRSRCSARRCRPRSRRTSPPAADQLRHPEGHRRAAARRLHPARLRRRRRHPAAHHLHPAGRAEPGGVRVLLQHPARAAGRPGGHAARARDRAALVRLAPLGRRVLPARRRPSTRS